MAFIHGERLRALRSNVSNRCTSLSAWELPKQESALAPESVWTNKDMDPVQPEEQTWSVWTWMAYWATDTISVGTWQTAGSIVAVGLSWREAIPLVSLLFLFVNVSGPGV